MGGNYGSTTVTTIAVGWVSLQHHSAVNQMENQILLLYHLSHKGVTSHPA
jgi:hypothetical protein